MVFDRLFRKYKKTVIPEVKTELFTKIEDIDRKEKLKSLNSIAN